MLLWEILLPAICLMDSCHVQCDGQSRLRYVGLVELISHDAVRDTFTGLNLPEKWVSRTTDGKPAPARFSMAHKANAR